MRVLAGRASPMPVCFPWANEDVRPKNIPEAKAQNVAVSTLYCRYKEALHRQDPSEDLAVVDCRDRGRRRRHSLASVLGAVDRRLIKPRGDRTIDKVRMQQEWRGRNPS